MKQCTKCGSEGLFYKDKQKTDGLSSHCASCIKQRVGLHRINNLARIQEYDRKRRYPRYMKNRKQEDERNRRWAKANPEKVKEIRERRKPKVSRNRMLRLYGLTELEFASMLVLQDHKCSICDKQILTRIEQHVDHDHKTGRVRGILCAKCNRGLGHFNDDFSLLQIAISYLRGYDEIF